MAASAIPAQPAPRIQSVDALRGAIMILMAIDHIREYIARSAMQFLPTDLARTTAAIFFTRWITHLCAPIFIAHGRSRRISLDESGASLKRRASALPDFSWCLAHIPRAHRPASDRVFSDQLPCESCNPSDPLGYWSFYDRSCRAALPSDAPSRGP